MAAEEFAFADPSLKRTLDRLLEGLTRHVEDDELHTLLYAGLRRFSRDGAIQSNYVAWANDELTRYAADPVTLPRSRIKARLIQQHLSFYLPREPSVAAPIPTDSDRAPGAAPDRGHDAEVPAPKPKRSVPPPAAAPKIQTARAAKPAPEDKLGQRRVRYEALKRSEQDAWQAIYGTVRDFTRLKELWVSNLDEVAREREALAQRLAETNTHLQRLEDQNRTLSAEVGELRNLSGAKHGGRALPRIRARNGRRPGALPRRDAFLRQLESEAERVRRHGTPLALALIDVEADPPSGEAGEASPQAQKQVLQCYAGKIFANFRSYDLVARYGDHTFAVLFPSTTRDGAVRALEKVQKRAAESHFQHDGRSHPLPSFSGVLAQYATGEDPQQLLERVDQALAESRRRGERILLVM